jgi:carbon-monoxide dehydrogenase large subunit
MFERRRNEAAARGALRGIGCSVFLEPSGGGIAPKDQIAINFTGERNIELFCVAGASGQGHETVFSELVAEKLGIDRNWVALRAGDPDGPVLTGSPSIGSRSALSHGSAFALGALQVIEKGRQIASDVLEAAPADIDFADGRYTVTGTDRSLSFAQVMGRAASMDSNPLDTLAESPVAYAFPSGAHIAEVEVDPETGAVQFASYTAVDDSGTVLNETLAAGQVCGGIIQGAGQVFGEVCDYDSDTGQMSTASFMDYVMPRADLLEKIRLVESPNPSPTNFLGAKGAGEAGTTGAVAACMSAILDALRPIGIDRFDMPVTPARVWAAIASAPGKQTAR